MHIELCHWQGRGHIRGASRHLGHGKRIKQRHSSNLSIYTENNLQLIVREQHFTLLAHISLYQSRVRLFVDHLNTLAHELIFAVHGSVMPSLIPPAALESFIQRISAETRFTPLFSMANATLLYSLLNIGPPIPRHLHRLQGPYLPASSQRLLLRPFT